MLVQMTKAVDEAAAAAAASPLAAVAPNPDLSLEGVPARRGSAPTADSTLSPSPTRPPRGAVALAMLVSTGLGLGKAAGGEKQRLGCW